jgi:ferrous iron transport protein B
MKRLALVGMPNTGKSTFFNRLTGATARVGNWPGVTVDLLGAKIILGADMVEVVDLPGLYDLHGFSEDELVVRHFLEKNPIDLIAIVLNASQIDHQIAIALQLKQLGLPTVLLLNMIDEASKLGIQIDTRKMSEILGMPVLALSAKYGRGFGEAKNMLTGMLAISEQRPGLEDLRSKLSQDDEVERQMQAIISHSVQLPIQLPERLTERLDKVLLHPWIGLPIFFGVMYLLFQGIFLLGSPFQAGVAWLLTQVSQYALEPMLASAPVWLHGLIINGIFNGVGTVASFVPIIVLFFLFMAVIEDTGYLSRAAFLMDALMSRLGLDGRSFVMLLMGFGCNVPALMGTRVMRSRPLRLLTMMVIPFSLCSARLQVFIFITAALFTPAHAPLVLFSLYMMSFATAILTALLFKGKFNNTDPFILELPPYRLPTLKQLWLRGWQEVRHFLHRATKFIVIGVVLVWALTHLPTGVAEAGPDTFAGMLGTLFNPVLSPLGIDNQMAITLIFGFVAKEIVVGALAVVYGMEGAALSHQIAVSMDWVQAYSFMLFTLIYTPCLSTIATMRSESRSNLYAAGTVAWSLGLAWVISFVFYQSARALGY